MSLGLLPPFKINRPLTAKEREQRLSHKLRSKAAPLGQMGVIRMNSTYLEIIDKHFREKGWRTLIALLVVLVCSWAFLVFAVTFPPLVDTVYKGRVMSLYGMLAFFLSIICAAIGVFGWIVRQESLRYTHYPIRLNRKKRMVYVFRLDGTVFEVAWDKVFFNLAYEPGFPSGNWAVHGHVLDADGVTICETFGLSEVNEPECVKRFWEFVRRYMEEGPRAVAPHLQYCIPVCTPTRRETLLQSYRHFTSIFGGYRALEVIMWPLVLPSVAVRWLSMRTGKVPVWPAKLDADCAIESNDPWRRDASTNPPGYR